ncbi:MAG: hypothetical protein ACJ8E5_19835 [Xanthobacteraceae bacterium]|jgi:hypothetical protein
MRRIVLAVMILALMMASADARRRGHRHHHHGSYDYGVQPDGSPTMMPGMSERDPPRSRSRGSSSRSRNSYGDPAAAMPPGWQLQPPEPNWSGKRFVSPDGAAWFALYATPVEHEPIAAHMKAVAFADGEEIIDLAGRPGWLAVTGSKGDRLFYRKAVLGCGGKIWRHIAFEFPADAKRRMEPFIARAAGTLDGDEGHGCDAISSR